MSGEHCNSLASLDVPELIFSSFQKAVCNISQLYGLTRIFVTRAGSAKRLHSIGTLVYWCWPPSPACWTYSESVADCKIKHLWPSRFFAISSSILHSIKVTFEGPYVPTHIYYNKLSIAEGWCEDFINQYTYTDQYLYTDQYISFAITISWNAICFHVCKVSAQLQPFGSGCTLSAHLRCRQSAWLHTVCSSAVCQLSTQSAPLWCVSPALFCQHTCAATRHATWSAPFDSVLKIKRMWHPVARHLWTLLYTLLLNDILSIRLGFARSMSVVSFVLQRTAPATFCNAYQL